MYLIECLEVRPAQAGTALAAPHILYLVVTSGQMGHCHLANPAPHKDTRMQNLEALFCKVFLQTGTMTDQRADTKAEVWSWRYEWAQHPVCLAADGPTSSAHAVMMHIVVAEYAHQHRQCARHEQINALRHQGIAHPQQHAKIC